ncbi:MAG TPA: glycosyltransferase, partial [Vicinamibacterales bacterium]|nr:glycosyltransferase [Vicinamibacterales bacterium]
MTRGIAESMMPRMPKISAVVATYNRRETLARTMPTLLAQDISCDDFEIIVVDDGSIDETLPYLHTIRSPCTLRVIAQSNRGAAAARNAGWRHVSSSLVIFLDDDLLCPPWLLRRHLDAHTQWPGGIIYGATNTARESPRTLAAELTRYASAQETRRLDRDATRPGRDLALDPNTSVLTDLMRRIGGFDESFGNFAETKDAAIRLRAVGLRFRYIKDAAVEQIYVKSSAHLAHDDAFAAGRNEWKLRRQHPQSRSESALACMGNGGPVRAALRRGFVTLPAIDSVISTLVQACEALSAVPTIRQAGVRLVRCRQSINFYRAAAAEAESWEALSREFGVKLPCLM